MGASATGRSLVVTCHDRDDVRLVPGLLEAWRDLLRRHPSRNPLCDPDSQLAWCAQFVPRGQERLLAVRHATTGTLVAMLPLFVNRLLPAVRWGRSLHVMGALHEPLVHELPELTLDPAHARPALAAALGWLYAHERWDWFDVDLRDDQPWPEPRWATDVGVRPIIIQRGDISSVVLELPDGDTGGGGGEGLRLGRNLRESLRRNRNRMARREGVWDVESASPDDGSWDAALADLVRVHGERAQIDGHTAHLDVFGGTQQRAFLDRVAATPAGARPTVHRLLHDGECAAALLTVESDDVMWVSVSGVVADAWDLSAVTGLQRHAVDLAVKAGRQAVILSTGVDTAKLRWSTTLALTHRFVIVHPRRTSVALFRLMLMVRSQRLAAREIERFRQPGDKGAKIVATPEPRDHHPGFGS